MKRSKIKIVDGLIFCYAIFNIDDGIDYEDMGVLIENIPTEEAETRLFIDEIESYNEASESSVIVRMKSTDSFEIKCTLNEFDKIILNYLKTKQNAKEI